MKNYMQLGAVSFYTSMAALMSIDNVVAHVCDDYTYCSENMAECCPYLEDNPNINPSSGEPLFLTCVGVMAGDPDPGYAHWSEPAQTYVVDNCPETGSGAVVNPFYDHERGEYNTGLIAASVAGLGSVVGIAAIAYFKGAQIKNSLRQITC